MAASLSLHFLTIAIVVLGLFTMRGFGFVLPAFVLSQLSGVSTSWIAPQYTAPKTLLDPDGNKLGAVASETRECSEIGTNILKAGGNAADSMVATVICTGVVGMYHS
jgi:gamma-glutamyltranspeptidase/glutathione hydrolase